jgi:hypothetical protein
MNMSDVYVEYRVSSTTGSPNVIRVFAKVPRAKIEAYRQAQNDQASSDTDIAYNLSELPALSSITLLSIFLLRCEFFCKMRRRGVGRPTLATQH